MSRGRPSRKESGLVQKSHFALTAFFVVSTACVTWRSSDLRATPPPSSGTAVGSLVKTSGELIKFGSVPARIRDGVVVGRATNVTPADVSIPLSDVKQIYYRQGNGTMTTLLVASLVGVTALLVVLMKSQPVLTGPILNGATKR